MARTVWVPNAEDLGPIPQQGTRFHMPQLKILRVATKTRCSQIKINKHVFEKKFKTGKKCFKKSVLNI